MNVIERFTRVDVERNVKCKFAKASGDSGTRGNIFGEAIGFLDSACFPHNKMISGFNSRELICHRMSESRENRLNSTITRANQHELS